MKWSVFEKELTLWIIILIVILCAIVGLGIIEENDMTKLNDLYHNTNLTNKYEVINYLVQLQSKPQWRVCLMIGLAGSYALTLLYRFLPAMNSILYGFIILAFLWIIFCAIHSYWGYHCVLPNGSEFTISSLMKEYRPVHRYMNCN